MNIFKNIFAESSLGRAILYLHKIYQESYGKKLVDFSVLSLENSVIINSLLGKRDDIYYYRHSLFFKLLSWGIALINRFLQLLAHLFHRAADTSFLMGLLKSAEEKMENKPLIVLGLFIMSFTGSYFFFKPALPKVAVLLVLNLGAIIFLLAGEVKVQDLLAGSRFYRLCKYLLE